MLTRTVSADPLGLPLTPPEGETHAVVFWIKQLAKARAHTHRAPTRDERDVDA